MRESVEHCAHDGIGQKSAAVRQHQPIGVDPQQAVADGGLRAVALLIAQRVGLEQVEIWDETGQPMKVLEVRPAPVSPSATTGPWQP